VTAPTLTNDMRGTFLARSLGAQTIAFGTHVTPLPVPTMEAFPTLSYILRGEPELTLRELVDTLEVDSGRWHGDSKQKPEPRLWPHLERMFTAADPGWQPPWMRPESAREQRLAAVRGLVWRDAGGQVCVNSDRPFIPNLDDLPLPMHHLLPWERYRAPNIKGPYTFVVPSRGCPAGCRFCIKHVSYGNTVRTRSPDNVLAELRLLWDMGLRNVNMYADLFTVNRDQVMGICEGMMRDGLRFKWFCNSRVDFVDAEMLQTMARAGCWLIAWGIESADEDILRRARKGITTEKVAQALRWSKQAGIMNWGYFIIGLPGETEDTIRRTIQVAKKLPLDIALFHIAGPYPGTPFFFEVLDNGWFRPGTVWEEVDMDESTVLDYPHLPAERIEYWARRAFREWAFRPRPILTYLKTMNNWHSARSAIDVGLQALKWAR